MRKVGMPQGLIRYSSQDALAGKAIRLVRARTIIYPIVIGVALTLFLIVLSTKFSFDARVIRARGAPFTVFQDRHIQNNFRLRLVNRSQTEQNYSLRTTDDNIVAKWSGGSDIKLAPGDSILAPIDVQFPLEKTAGSGSTDTLLKITDDNGATREINVRLMGPR